MRCKKNKIVVGKVYALWCSYCIAMAPVFQKIKMDNKYKDKVDFLEIQDIELDEQKPKINKKYLKPSVSLEVNGFPTVFLIKNKKINYFNGDTTNGKEIEKWIESFISHQCRRKTRIQKRIKRTSPRRKTIRKMK